MKRVIFAFLLAYLISFLIAPLVKRLAIWIGAMDRPSPRKVHAQPTPRLGGLSVYLGALIPPFGYAVYWALFNRVPVSISPEVRTFLLASTLIFLLGALDDIRRIRPSIKLLFEIGVAIIFYVHGFQISTISIFSGETYQLGWFSLPVTILWLVGIANAMNIIDGLDGLASGVAFFASLTMAIITIINHDYTFTLFFISLAGALMGFLRYNFIPASIFLGDSGSLFIGFFLASLSVVASQIYSTMIALLIPIIALGIPITDTFLAAIRRPLNGVSIFKADQGHIHHRLLDFGYSHRKSVVVLYGVCLVLCLVALSLVFIKIKIASLFFLIIGGITLLGIKKLGYFEYFK